ncbi:hypothetical protein [Paraburkholderia terrae]|uniref:hypothetical protein n=1 Tax=Paraburkholderia terrae TaxID=311230 RepID=UPI001EE1BB56|nr:hypothetical protein [Paraburkholderia terrae]GJH02286.1 hypothetical protein CBA19C8_17035 [Paraburkholderia terrae]
MTTATEVVEKASPVVNIVQKIEALAKPRDLMKRAKTLEEDYAKSFFELGGVLSRIKTGIASKEAGFEKYQSFSAYVAEEHRISISQINKMIFGYESLVAKQIPYEKVATLPWSSLVALVPALTPENVDELVPAAEKMSYKQISALPVVKGSKDKTKAKAANAGVAKKGKATSAAPTPEAGEAPSADDKHAAVLAYLTDLGVTKAVALLKEAFPDANLALALKKSH